jgi:hypothetical protein
MISENKMEYRGSKSADLLNNVAVKEQRVDGSFCIKRKPMQIRCTLMEIERNYLIKILSSQLQLNKKYFSTLKQNLKLHPWFLTGFVDAEGTFSISIQKDKEYKIKWVDKFDQNFQLVSIHVT